VRERTATSVIGAPVARVEGADKVTGRAIYASDVPLPGTLWCRILRSPYAHARIVRIDTTRARGMPGVHAVLTGQNVQGRYVGKAMRDMPLLCWDRVRFIGDRVAAVAADSRDIADAALEAIEVEYEELPAVFDPVAAMEPNAPLLHDDLTKYAGAPPERLATDVPNGCTRVSYAKGDVARGFREADLVLEHTFEVPGRHQGYLEPHAMLLAIGIDGRVQVWAACKQPFRARTMLAQTTGLPETQIRINSVFVGADFGGKGDAVDLPIAYYLAQQTGRPVKLLLTYREELTASNPIHPTLVTIRSGVTRDGRLVARQVRTLFACGAYAALKAGAALPHGHYTGGCYRIPHTSFEFLQIYTNTVPGGYFRSPGGTQHTFALECHTDLLAHELGMDPAEFRLRNMLNEGEEDAIGVTVRNMKAREVLEAALQAASWQGRSSAARPHAVSSPAPAPPDQPRRGERKTPARGRGIAMFGRAIGGGAAGSVLTAETDGSLSVLSPTVDVGPGTHTIVRQMVAEEMGVPIDRVRVTGGDTDSVPYDEGPRSSRVTYTEGGATLEACEQLRGELAPHAAQLLACRPEELTYREGAFWNADEQVTLAEVVARAGRGLPVVVTAEVHKPEQGDVQYYCAQIADVAVDPETGQVRVERLITAHDVGTIINPITHQGQIDGSVGNGIGMAVTEELIAEEGRITNPHLGEYKLPTMPDMPVLETVLVRSGGGTGPYEAKAIGEFANANPPAAIANAVADAVGARLFVLPITAERVLQALEA
jgi:CO/xanthine dehydrogenase Mo-binding subunit